MTAISRAAEVTRSAIIDNFSQVCRWMRENRWAVLTGFIALLLLVLLWMLWIVGFLGWLSYKVGLFQAEARIYVEPPQVYTRERLVNDRFRESNWLEGHLKSLGTGSDEGPSRYSSVEANRSVVADNTADRQRQAGETEPQAPLPLLSIDKIDAFNLAFERRVAVRSEMLNTLLDDGHDLSGTTLYRMNFDVSVVPRPGAKGFGLVAIDVEPYSCKPGLAVDKCYSIDPEVRLGERIADYRRLLGSWEQDLQDFLSKIYRDRTAFRGVQAPDPFGGSPKERMAFNGYVKAKAVEYWIGVVAGPNGFPRDNCTTEEQLFFNNADVRMEQVRQALNIPGTATLLPNELPERLEQAFTREIKRHSDLIADRIKLRELERFVQEVDKALAACPRRSDNEKGCATCWKPNAQPKITMNILPKCEAAEETNSGNGEGENSAGNAEPQDSSLFVVATPVNPEGQPAQAKATAAGSANSKADSPTTARPDHPAKETDRSSVLRLSGLPGLDSVCDKQSSCEPATCGKSKAYESNKMRNAYSAIVESEACSAGRPFVLPWDEKIHGVRCPASLPDHVMNMYGLVRMASLVRDVHRTLVAHPKDGGNGNDQVGLPTLAYKASQEEIRKHSKALYACISEGPDDKTCKESLCLSKNTVSEIEELRKTHGLSGKDIEEPDRILSLYKMWFSEFFVDRLSRTDIPGYQPSPSVDRFFDVRQVGCETGACDILVNRKRWLSRENWLEVGQIIERHLRRYSDSPLGPSRQPPLGDWLRILLPNTNHYCTDKANVDCRKVILAALKAAEHCPSERSVITAADFSTGQQRFEKLLDCAYRCPINEDFAICADGDASITGLDNNIRYVAWDFAQTIVALSLEERLERIGGEISVYAIEPRTRSLVEQSAAKQSLRLAASLQALPKVAGTGFEYLEAAQEVAQRLERIGAQPTLVGFGHLRGDAKDNTKLPGASFGWMFLPNRLESKGLFGTEIATHKPETYRLAAVLSVPSWWSGLQFTVRQCWGRPGMLAANINTDPYQAEEQCDGKVYRPGLAPAGRTKYRVELPASTERITEVFDFEVIKIPYIDDREIPPELEAGRAGKVVIEGGRLWRGTMVTLQEQQADEITVLPDMKGVVASFSCVEPIAGRQQYTDYKTLTSDPPSGLAVHDRGPAKLTVWTAQGKDTTDVSIWPFKQRVEGEQPCWDVKIRHPGQPAGQDTPDQSPTEE